MSEEEGSPPPAQGNDIYHSDDVLSVSLSDLKSASPSTEKSLSSPKAKSKDKPKTVNDLMHSPKQKIALVPSPAAAEESGEDEVPIEEDEEDFLVSDGEESKAAVKAAQLALTRTVDVDVDGGWKFGDPWVVILICFASHGDLLITRTVAFPTPR